MTRDRRSSRSVGGAATGESRAGVGIWRGAWRLLLAAALVFVVIYAYRQSGLWENPEALREASGARAAAVIFIVMVCAWAFALPASAFLLITPLIFPPHLSVPITTAGCTVGAGAGYLVARFAGGWWVERRGEGRLRRFLTRHSSFLAVAALRLAPGVPHGFVNYAAGLAYVPFARFILATALAMCVKSYVYAEAVSGAVEASSLSDALSAKTVLALLGLAALSLAGHALIKLRSRRDQEAGAARAGGRAG